MHSIYSIGYLQAITHITGQIMVKVKCVPIIFFIVMLPLHRCVVSYSKYECGGYLEMREMFVEMVLLVEDELAHWIEQVSRGKPRVFLEMKAFSRSGLFEDIKFFIVLFPFDKRCVYHLIFVKMASKQCIIAKHCVPHRHKIRTISGNHQMSTCFFNIDQYLVI